MNELPLAVQRTLRRLSRRLTLGLFLQVWPPWAAGTVLVAGVLMLVGRVFVPQAAAVLHWLWLAPVVALMPAALLCYRRAYRPAQVAVIADSLAGGHGMLLSLLERPDEAWTGSPMLARIATLSLPRLQPWRRLLPLLPSLAFLAIAWFLPQRVVANEATALADQVVADLAATVMELKTQQLITPEEEKTLEEEIEKIRKAASKRLDASSWEATDGMNERMAADVARKRDVVSWAQQSLSRYAAAAAAAGRDGGAAAADARTELMSALQKLGDAGLLAGAPADIAALLNGRGGLPRDAASLRALQASLGRFLGDGRGLLRAAGEGWGNGEAGRFDPGEFPLDGDEPGDVAGGRPGRGGVTRGRADAQLTWGQETKPSDRFKPQALPPGYVRGPDDFAPIAELPGAPQVSPEASVSAAARGYADGAGQEAWRRTVTPRHQRAVRKYFEVSR